MEEIRKLKEDYSLFKHIVFGTLTLGIYCLWEFHNLSRDVNDICTLQKQKTTGIVKYVLFSLLTFGLYSYFWWYRVADMVKRATEKHELNCKVNPVMTVLSFALGNACFGICTYFALYHIFEAVNELANDYNNDPTPYTVPEPEPVKKKTYGYQGGWGD